MLEILNVHTDMAHWGQINTERESALKFNSVIKICCYTMELNQQQQPAELQSWPLGHSSTQSPTVVHMVACKTVTIP